jgi:nucleoside 2-deoxyribosyltransferase
VKIYLACTVRGDRNAVIALRAASARLQARGHEVLTAHLLGDDVEEVEAALSERAVYERDIAWLDGCDALVADASGSSFGVGFEVGYILARAPQTGQRVYLLYNSARRPHISRMITGNSDPHCSKYAYTSAEDLLAFIDAHFE